MTSNDSRIPASLNSNNNRKETLDVARFVYILSRRYCFIGNLHVFSVSILCSDIDRAIDATLVLHVQWLVFIFASFLSKYRLPDRFAPIRKITCCSSSLFIGQYLPLVIYCRIPRWNRRCCHYSWYCSRSLSVLQLTTALDFSIWASGHTG